MQKNKIMQCLKTLIRRLLWCTLGLLLLFFYARYSFPMKWGNCEKYTQYLNGGVHKVGDTSYRVTMCGTHGIFNGDTGDQARLQIHSMDGELLVERWFTVHWDSNFPRKVRYTKKGLTYYDPADENHFEKSIDLPPTRWDKLRARFL